MKRKPKFGVEQVVRVLALSGKVYEQISGYEPDEDACYMTDSGSFREDELQALNKNEISSKNREHS